MSWGPPWAAPWASPWVNPWSSESGEGFITTLKGFYITALDGSPLITVPKTAGFYVLTENLAYILATEAGDELITE